MACVYKTNQEGQFHGDIDTLHVELLYNHLV